MSSTPSSASSAKDDGNTLDLNELALAMYADSLGLTDEEYEELRARNRRPKHMQPPQNPTTAEAFVAGAFVMLIVAAIVITITHWGWK